MEHILFNNWDTVIRTLIIGVLAYVVLIIQLRISGKRTLTKMNSFDFVVTVAFGSTLATILLSKDVALAEGATAFALLIILQYIITWLSVRSNAVQQLVKATPTLLLYKGRFLDDEMKKARVTREEILAAIRTQGIGDMSKVDAVVMETEGSLSVIKDLATGENSVLQYVKPERP